MLTGGMAAVTMQCKALRRFPLVQQLILSWHLLAMAHSIGIKLSLDDFTEIGKKTPVLADLKPFGSHYMSELNASGGIQPLMKSLLERGLLHGDCITVTGKTIRENLEEIQPYENDNIISCLLYTSPSPRDRG